MMLDRTVGPPLAPIKQLNFPHGEPLITNGGRKAWFYPSTQIGVAKLYIIFPYGYRITQEPWVMKAAAQLMLSGSDNHKAREIQEALEHIGATIDVQVDAQYHQIVISARTEHLSDALNIWIKYSELVQFPQKEVDVYLSAAVSDLQMSQTTPRYWAHRRLMEALCGKDHYLGKYPEVSDIERISSDHLKSYSKWFCGSTPAFLVICGDTTEQHIQELGSLLGAPDFGVDFVQTSPETHMNKLWQTPVAHTNQASIMWGLPGLQIADKDYYGFWVLNTLLGGFFGSRLMKNIREEKGLTYGIHSSLVNHGFAYHWYISSEVKEGNVRLVNEEISKEIFKLSTESTSNEELEKVKRYLSGNLKMSFDGVFSMAAKRRDLYLFKRSEKFYDLALSEIHAVTPTKIQTLASNFLRPEAFYVSIAGSTQ